MKQNFINKQNMAHRLIQFLILILHLLLLVWIIYVLRDGGIMSFKDVMLHFTGLSLTGGFLIFGCAQYYKRRFLKGQND